MRCHSSPLRLALGSRYCVVQRFGGRAYASPCKVLDRATGARVLTTENGARPPPAAPPAVWRRRSAAQRQTASHGELSLAGSSPIEPPSRASAADRAQSEGRAWGARPRGWSQRRCAAAVLLAASGASVERGGVWRACCCPRWGPRPRLRRRRLRAPRTTCASAFRCLPRNQLPACPHPLLPPSPPLAAQHHSHHGPAFWVPLLLRRQGLPVRRQVRVPGGGLPVLPLGGWPALRALLPLQD